jgi:VWFA-related protein
MRACVLPGGCKVLPIVLMALLLVLPAEQFTVLAQQQKEKDQKPPVQTPEGAISVEVPVVQVDVVVTDNRGNYITGLRKENFRILEDKIPQQVANFASTEAPITIVILLEFSKLGYEVFAYNATEWAYGFLSQLKKDDWVALVSYDIRPRIEVDFTKNKMEVQQHLARMYFPGFSEANLFDALHDTLDRLEDVKGKKAVLLLASGFDTFSKKTLGDTLKRVQETDTSIFAVGVGRELMEYLDARGQIGGAGRVSYLQAENQMNAFARATGGRAWFPRFQGELRGIFQDVALSLRNQYSLGYTPTNQARDGKFRKIKVEIVDENGQPLIIKDQNNKPVKYVVYAREGYNAPKGKVGD